MALLVINEMTDKPLETVPLHSISPMELAASRTPDGMVVPALGLAWASCVNTRLVLTRHRVATNPNTNAARLGHEGGQQTDHADEGSSCGTSPTRRLHMVFSPRLQPCICPFQIREDGIAGYGNASVGMAAVSCGTAP